MRTRQYELVDSDMDYRIYQRVIKGRLTKARLKKLSRFARRNTWREHCHHEWDCCGCMTSQRVELELLNHTEVRIIVRESFNY